MLLLVTYTPTFPIAISHIVREPTASMIDKSEGVLFDIASYIRYR
jgi:hypothetical protein